MVQIPNTFGYELVYGNTTRVLKCAVDSVPRAAALFCLQHASERVLLSSVSTWHAEAILILLQSSL